ncbi:hypothetical protein EVA_18743, partial [gut metagenome]
MKDEIVMIPGTESKMIVRDVQKRDRIGLPGLLH